MSGKRERESWRRVRVEGGRAGQRGREGRATKGRVEGRRKIGIKRDCIWD